jgi:hypothetical protein
MHVKRGDWRVSIELDKHCNPLRVALAKDDGDGPRTIVEWFPGPFDPAEGLVSEALEMIEQYEWKGIQLPIPGIPGQ